MNREFIDNDLIKHFKSALFSITEFCGVSKQKSKLILIESRVFRTWHIASSIAHGQNYRELFKNNLACS